MRSAEQRAAGLGLVVLFSLAASGTMPMARAESSEKGTTTVDAKSEKVIRQLIAHIGDAKAVKLSGRIRAILTPGNEEHALHGTSFTLTTRRPNRVNMTVRTGPEGVQIVSDGDKVYKLDVKSKEYYEAPAPKDLTEIFQDVRSVVFGGPVFVPRLISGSDFQEILSDVRSVSYVGLEKSEGTTLHHLRFDRGRYVWEMWATSGKKPLVRRIVSKIDKRKTEPDDKEERLTITADFRGWDVGSDVGEEAFAFAPPPGAKKAKRQPKPEPPKERKHPMIGKSAPDFKLKLLNGGGVWLASHQNKHVVILDFWATWCPPCVRALPIYAKVAENYKDKGVRFYAINLREQPFVIQHFLRKQKLDIPVALDETGKVAKDYGVRSIPTSFIIGRDGKIKAVHLGMSLDLAGQLEEELEAILKEE